MKPKEFDELLKQKFDQNDFEYDPRSWDRLEEQLDGRSKRRSIIMWWLMPVAGIAASVALAMGVGPLLKYQGGRPGAGSELAKVQKTEVVRPAQAAPQTDNTAENSFTYNSEAGHTTRHIANKVKRSIAAKQMNEDDGEDVAINLQNALPANNKGSRKTIEVNLLDAKAVIAKKDKEQKKEKQAEPLMATFKPEAEKKEPKMSLTLIGGYNRGTQNAGYSAGATIRKDLSEHVFIEGDVAYASSNIDQAMPYYKPTVVSVQRIYGPDGKLVSATELPTGGAKTTSTTTTTTASGYKVTVDREVKQGPRYVDNVNFDLSYAQIHPAIGVKIMKIISIGAGPDFQQALSDNRPAASNTNIDAPQKYPLFDVGLVGRTECNITRNIKAGVSYRKGVNSVLAPGANYLDRDYLQFHLNYAVFNK